MMIEPYLSILNGFLLALPIYYYVKLKQLGNVKFYLSIALIILYGILESIYGFSNKLFILYIGDLLLLIGCLVVFKELINHNVYKKTISNPVISIVLVFVFLLGTAITNNIFNTPYFITATIYFTAIVTLAHIYQLINPKGIQIPETLLIISIIVCYIYDTQYYSGKISLEEYNEAPWFFQYMLQSLAGIFSFIQIKLYKMRV